MWLGFPPNKVKRLLFIFSVSGRGKVAAFLLCFLPPIPENEILGCIAHFNYPSSHRTPRSCLARSEDLVYVTLHR